MHRSLPVLTAALLQLACTTGSDSGSPEATQQQPPPTCIADGQFRADLYGAVRSRLDWHGSELSCEGMRRPHGAGARLRFAGTAPGNESMHQLAIIVALPDLQQGMTAAELPATVTIIEEDNGRFFSNADNETCWADVNSQQQLATGDKDFAVAGIVYCVAPLAALNSTESISIRNLQFTGRIDWQENK